MAATDDPLAQLAEGGQEDGERRKVLGQTGMGDAFDEDILAEIERRLEREEFSGDEVGEVADKVELDRADLALDELPSLEEDSFAAPEMEVDLADEPPPLEADLDAEAKPGSKRLIVYGGVALLVLLLAGGGWFFMGGEPEKPKKPEPVREPLPLGAVRAPMPQGPTSFRIEIKPFIVPLVKGPEGRLLRLKVTLETTDPDGQTLVDSKSIAVRDTIYRLFRDRPAAELSSERAKKLLQAQIKTELNALLEKNVVHRVYFTEFVITG